MDCICDLGLTELKRVGMSYSWSNKGHGTARIASKIDKGLVNGQWMLQFQHVSAHFLPPSLSDHSPVLFKVCSRTGGGGRPFKFFNVLASQKFFSPRCMIKVYLRKAYYSIEWSFLQCMLSELGFPSVFIKRVMDCVTTVSYSIMVNGQPTTPFQSRKGVRQAHVTLSFCYWDGLKVLG